MEYAQKHLKVLQAKLDAERPAEPIPEEGKELDEAQKNEIAKQRQNENLLKIAEVEKRIQEAPQFKFNTNVFK